MRLTDEEFMRQIRRSIYWPMPLLFITSTGQTLDVLKRYHPLADEGLKRFASENATLWVCALVVLIAWLLGTFLRIRDIGVRRPLAYLLCAGVLACCAWIAWLWISAS